jgi:hypothetical protein
MQLSPVEKPLEAAEMSRDEWLLARHSTSLYRRLSILSYYLRKLAGEITKARSSHCRI